MLARLWVSRLSLQLLLQAKTSKWVVKITLHLLLFFSVEVFKKFCLISLVGGSIIHYFVKLLVTFINLSISSQYSFDSLDLNLFLKEVILNLNKKGSFPLLLQILSNNHNVWKWALGDKPEQNLWLSFDMMNA